MKKEKEILVVIKMPGARATTMTINGNNTLEDLQRMVSGYIEVLPYHDEKFSVLVNEEGAINGMPYNCQFDESSIFGPAVIVKNGDYDFESLSNDEARYFVDKFNGKPVQKKFDKYEETENAQDKFIELAMDDDISFASFIIKDTDGGMVNFKGASNLPINGHIIIAAAMIEKAANLMIEKSRSHQLLPKKDSHKLAVKIVINEVMKEIKNFKDGEVM